MTIRRVFLEELEKLNNDVIKMGSLLEHSINQVVTALKSMDSVLADQIIEDDDLIDELEQTIEQDCINIIARQQPVARDLRRVTSIMRIIADIERIADHCSDISKYIIKLSSHNPIQMPGNILHMIDEMKKMVKDAIDSFVSEDVEKARKVMASDDKVDQLFADITEELVIAMKHNTDSLHAYVDYLMIIKYLERMADHATNVAEWITFISTGNLSESMLGNH
jgi:phosphate transport system protein